MKLKMENPFPHYLELEGAFSVVSLPSPSYTPFTKGLSKNYVIKNEGVKSTRFSSLADPIF